MKISSGKIILKLGKLRLQRQLKVDNHHKDASD